VMEKNDVLWVKIIKYLSLALAVFIVLFPLYSVVVGAFKTQVEYYNSGLRLPENFLNFENFQKVFEVGKLALGFQNILIIIAVSLAGNILIGT
ncbi:hypothetical protein ABTC76_20125, partial [Acinetobacter baumannii]